MGHHGEGRGYRVDRTLLEQKPTDEILRILDEESDDYTREAIEIMEDILKSRGISVDSIEDDSDVPFSGQIAIHSAADAIPVMNEVLNGVLQGTMDPEVGKAAAQIVTCILQAFDQRMMHGQGGGT
jgi:hypothetical protein